MDLKKLQEEVNARWDKQKDNPCHGSDEKHALLHMWKAHGKIAEALGRIASVQNDAGHESRSIRPEDVDKYLADLVISVARFAHGVTDLDEACVQRLVEKFPITSPAWGVYDVEQHRWWPRAFVDQGEAQAHYDRCKGPGSRGEVRLMPMPVP